MKFILLLLIVLSLAGCARGYIAGKEPLQCSTVGDNVICDINTTTSTAPSVEPLRPSYLPQNAPVPDNGVPEFNKEGKYIQ